MRPKASEHAPAPAAAAAALSRIDGMLEDKWQTSIKTHKVFGHKFDDEAFSEAEMRAANKGLESAPVKAVSLKGGFHPQQTNLHVANLKSKITSGHLHQISHQDMPAVVIRKNGERHLFDGHHRVAAAMLMGNTAIRARVYHER